MYSPPTVYTVSMASGATVSTGMFTLCRSFHRVYLEVPTMTSGCDIYLQGSSNGTTFRRIKHPPVNTSAAQVHDWYLASSITQRMVEIPAGFKYIRPELSTAMTATAVDFKLICSE